MHSFGIYQVRSRCQRLVMTEFGWSDGLEYVGVADVV